MWHLIVSYATQPSVKRLGSAVVSSEGAPTLAEDKRKATVERILRAARHLVGNRGLDVTMDEIASAAGVGRRTLFRHFSSREALLAAAVESGVRAYGERLPAYGGGDWQAWLRSFCHATHRMNASYGPGYWELTTRRDLSRELSAVELRRDRARRSAMRRIAATLWSAAGGAGTTPSVVEATVAAHLSVHFTAAVTSDAGKDWSFAAESACVAIATTVEQAVSREEPASSL